MTSPDRIHSLIARFLDGDTSCSEERELYLYFKLHPKLEPELERYRDMFAWYSSLAPAASASAAAQPLPARLPKMKRWLPRASAAAIVALALGTAAVWQYSSRSHSDEYASYAGSYIFRDGRKITDLNEVVPELLRAERMIDERLAALERSLDEPSQAWESAVSSRYSNFDPEARQVYLDLLDY